MQISNTVYGIGDDSLVDSAKSLNNTGVYYHQAGDYINAEKYYRRSLELKKIIYKTSFENLKENR